jgi:hypothetical protein
MNSPLQDETPDHFSAGEWGPAARAYDRGYAQGVADVGAVRGWGRAGFVAACALAFVIGWIARGAM